MINLTTYMQRRMEQGAKATYGLWLEVSWMHTWAALVKGRAYLTRDGSLVINDAGNGAVRVMLGGLITAAAGLLVAVRGLFTALLIAVTLPLLPLVALGLHVWTQRRLAKSLREFEARVAAAREGMKK